MSVSYGFYDSLSGDRRYNASQFSSMFDTLVKDGVFTTVGTAFAVASGTGMQVAVGIGRAWFKHTWTYNDSILTLAIDTAHAVLNRIDTVVLETDSSEQVRANSIKVITGTPATLPDPPTLIHTTYVNQYPLAYVYVPAGSTQIINGNITWKVGSDDTPFITGILETISSDAIVAQWEAQFELWFQFLQDELDENQAANLLAQILEHDHSDVLFTKIPSGGLLDGAVSLLKLAASLRFQKLFEFAGDGVSNFDWTSIPQDFNHLLLMYSGLSTAAGANSWYDLYIQVNGDSGNNYHSALWIRDTFSEKWQWGITNPHNKGLHCGILPGANVGNYQTGSGLVLIPNYKGSLYKSAIQLTFFMAGAVGMALGGSQWISIAAISRLTGWVTSPYYPRVGSLFTLYGFN
jgi:hypothetical protein